MASGCGAVPASASPAHQQWLLTGAIPSTDIESLKAASVKCVVWDFDLTILSIHSYAERIAPAAVATRDMTSDFCDLSFFTTLVRQLAEHHIAVAVASFGKYEVIQAYMDRAFGIEADTAFSDGDGRLFHRSNIITPGSVGGVDGCSLKEGKNVPLQVLTIGLSLTPAQVLFFDGELPGIASWRCVVSKAGPNATIACFLFVAFLRATAVEVVSITCSHPCSRLTLRR